MYWYGYGMLTGARYLLYFGYLLKRFYSIAAGKHLILIAVWIRLQMDKLWLWLEAIGY